MPVYIYFFVKVPKVPGDTASVSLFEFTDYRAYLRAHVARLPKNGRGELTRIAAHLAVNTTLLSQIMSGAREFTPEQAFALSAYLGHSVLEADYFSLLVQIERAGTKDLKDHLERKRKGLKTDALKLAARISHQKKLSDQDRAVFYSSWIYSAVHLYTSVGKNGVTL